MLLSSSHRSAVLCSFIVRDPASYAPIVIDPTSCALIGYRYDNLCSDWLSILTSWLQSITYKAYSNNLVPASHKQPHLLLFYSDWCFSCSQVNSPFYIFFF